jgi:DNA-binding NtrC family response regulator
LGNAAELASELHAKATRKPLLTSRPSENHPVVLETSDCSPILEQVTKAKQQAETDAILAALNSTRWNRKQAAALLKIDYKALLYKMKKLGLEDRPVPLPVRSEAPKSLAAANGG